MPTLSASRHHGHARTVGTSGDTSADGARMTWSGHTKRTFPRTGVFLAALVGLVGLVPLVGCTSAPSFPRSSTSTTRMVVPSEVPRLDEGFLERPVAEPRTRADRRTELWVRSVHLTSRGRAHTVTVASAANGSFSLTDGRPTTATTPFDPPGRPSCRIMSERPLAAPVRGAASTTDTLYVLHCAGGAMNLPILTGTWSGGGSTHQTQAVVGIGGPEAQGQPTPAAGPDSTTRPTIEVVTATHQGNRATLVVRATEGSVLTLSSYATRCTTRLSGPARKAPGSDIRTLQYRMDCMKVTGLANAQVMATRTTGVPGAGPRVDAAFAPLPNR